MTDGEPSLGAGPTYLPPIVVGGCHRSGTSLVRRILDAHSQIHCGPEIKLLWELFGPRRPDAKAHLHFISSARSLLPEKDLVEVLLPALCELHRRSAAYAGKARWADKNPENVIHVWKWSRLLGKDWTFVHVVRNPLDTLASMKEANMPYALPPTLSDRIIRYVKWTSAGISFSEANPDICQRVVYEELVSSPADEIAALMNSVGATFEQTQLMFNQSPHQAGLEDPKIALTDRVHEESVGRWREVLTAHEAQAVRRATEETWRRIDPDGRWLD